MIRGVVEAWSLLLNCSHFSNKDVEYLLVTCLCGMLLRLNNQFKDVGSGIL